jgi:integrase
MRFTDKSIQALRKKAERYEMVEDGGTGLSVRVSRKGVKTFNYLYRFGGKPRRMALGIYRDRALVTSGGAASHDARGLPYITLADARIKLAEARKKRDAGIDPGAEAVQGHMAERMAETVDELIDNFLEKYVRLNKRPSSAHEDERMLNKDLRPAWGGRKASSITRADVIKLLDAVVARGPVAANRLFAVTRTMFRWAMRQGTIPSSTAFEIDRPVGKEVSRDRKLDAAEIIEVWNAAGALQPPYRELVRFLLASGQRRGEVAGMSRRELDLEAKIWTVPRNRSKSGLAHEVPLPPLTMEILEPLLAAAAEKNRQFLFASGRRGDRPIVEFKQAKRRLDAEILKTRREKPADAVPMPGWVLHDLRRTMRTGLSKLRVDSEIAERTIAHIPAGVRKVYDVHQYRDEKREAMTAWAEHLEKLIAADAAGDRVVRLRSGAA